MEDCMMDGTLTQDVCHKECSGGGGGGGGDDSSDDSSDDGNDQGGSSEIPIPFVMGLVFLHLSDPITMVDPQLVPVSTKLQNLQGGSGCFQVTCYSKLAFVKYK